jgi:hypothetical protein
VLAWWVALHALLLGAAGLVGAAGWLRMVLALAVVVHGVLRRPAATPAPILVAEDGSCCVPALGPAWLEPGPRTRLTAYGLRLSLADRARTHDILLCVDQVDAAGWARLNARLRRRAAPGTPATGSAQTTGRADLR